MSLFDKTIQRMEQEVRDLKTSHQIAVGSLTFYRESGSTTTPSSGQISEPIYIRITVKSGERAYPFVQIHWSDDTNSKLIVGETVFGYADNGNIVEIATVGRQATKYNVIATSTSAFDLIVKNYEPSDWQGPNPPE